MVVRHGCVVAAGWRAPYSRDRPQLLYSLTKSFISIAVGFAAADGLLGLGDRVVDVLDDHVPPGVSPSARQLGVHHLLTMTTGHRADTLAEAWALACRTCLTTAFSAPMGVEHPEWDRVGSGATFGFHGLHLTTEAVAAFGLAPSRNTTSSWR